MTIRKRITIEDINNLTLELTKKAQANKKQDGNGDDNSGAAQTTDLKADATSADAEMRYSTDIDLVEDGSKYIDRLLDKVSEGCPQTSERAQPHTRRVSAGYQTQAQRREAH